MFEARKEAILEVLNTWGTETLMKTLGIRYTDLGEDFIEGEMPVDGRVHQPLGLLHGGATAALAETLGSAGSSLHINREKQAALGIEIQATHVRGLREGIARGRARLIHKGASLHLWEIEVRDQNNRMLSHCKLTVMIVPLRDR